MQRHSRGRVWRPDTRRKDEETMEVAATNKTIGMKVESRLAILGGEPVRKKPMPPRRAIGDDEVAAIHEVISFYRERGLDPGYQGEFEKRYTDTFVAQMGGGYADAVATGTTALFIAVAALGLPE